MRQGLWVVCLALTMLLVGSWSWAEAPSTRPVSPKANTAGATQKLAPAKRVQKTPDQGKLSPKGAPATPVTKKEQAKNGGETSAKSVEKNRGKVTKKPEAAPSPMVMLAKEFEDKYWNQGPWKALLLIFFMGFLVSLTPCVYPMIPITIAVIGASQAGEEKKRGRSFFLAFDYVLGMSLPAIVLGIVVTQIGKLPFMMGGMMQSQWFVIGLVVLFFLMSLSMFGLFDLNLPSSWQTRLAGFQGKGFIGVFVLGMIGIILSTPCSGPVMIGLYAFLGQSGNVLLGILLPFVFVLGIGVPFLILGGGVVEALPRSGKWMVEIKKVFGVILLGASLFYANYAFRRAQEVYVLVVAVSLLFLAVFSGAFRSYGAGDWWWDRLKQVFGLLCLLVGVYLFLGGLLQRGFLLPPLSQWGGKAKVVVVHKAVPASAASTLATQGNKATGATTQAAGNAAPANDPCLPPADHPQDKPFWFTDEKKGVACAKKLKRPIVIDFWADWCTSCKQLERESFNHPEAVKEGRRFVMIKIEYSESTPEDERLRKKYGIPGLPWVRFITADGKLLPKPLIVGFVNHQKLLQLMRSVK